MKTMLHILHAYVTKLRPQSLGLHSPLIFLMMSKHYRVMPMVLTWATKSFARLSIHWSRPLIYQVLITTNLGLTGDSQRRTVNFVFKMRVDKDNRTVGRWANWLDNSSLSESSLIGS